ncbi:uncharacterized protein LOC136042625 [Artemia franciscana]|uniref:uncharacterized protein LOC136042625 n=1 Tax=Artemia franciscana TaxID=6661 RepID=UPI0032DB5012
MFKSKLLLISCLLFNYLLCDEIIKMKLCRRKTIINNKYCCYNKLNQIECEHESYIDESIAGVHDELIVINSNLTIGPYLITNVNFLKVVNSNITIGNSFNDGCYNTQTEIFSVPLNIDHFEIVNSTLIYNGEIKLPNLVNITIVKSSISANFLDLTWTMQSKDIRSVMLVDCIVVTEPCKMKCVSKEHKEFIRPLNLRHVSLRGTEFRCSYIATAATQWFLGLSKDIIDEPEKNCTGELAQFGTSTYLEISKVSQAFNSMTRDCPTECCCWYSQMTYSKEKEDFIYRVEVNCSHKNLTAIPIQKFPNYVSVLDISHNNVSKNTRSSMTFKSNSHAAYLETDLQPKSLHTNNYLPSHF